MTSSTTLARSATSVSMVSLRRNRSPSSTLAAFSASRNALTALTSPRSAFSSAPRSISGAGDGSAFMTSCAAIGGAQGQDLEARIRDEHRVLPLCGQGVVLRDDGPTVGQQFHVALAGVHHRLDGDGHARHELDAGAGPAVMQHLRVLVEPAADTVPAVLAHHGKALLLDVALDRVADVAELAARAYRPYASPHRVEAHLREPFALYRRRADREHAARVPVITVLDDGDVDIDDVPIT